MLDLGRALRRRVSRTISFRRPSFRRPMTRKATNLEPSTQDEAADLDEERRRRNIRLYVYRLYEVRSWLAECLTEADVPSPIELEEALRSGVLLAKIANYFAPDLVPLEKIFDLDESRLHDEGFHYRHTDNINLWRKACLSVRIKDIVLPDPVDVYAGRNIKTVLALVTLANQLYRLRKSPPIRDQTGNVRFTEETYKILGSKVGLANGNFALGPTAAQAIALPDEPSVEMILKNLRACILENDLEGFIRLFTSNNFIVHVDQDYMSQYFEVLSTMLSMNAGDIGLDDVQRAIDEVNRRNGLEKLHTLLLVKEVDLKELAHVILSLDICDGRVLEAYLQVYLNELRILSEKEELDIASIERVVAVVNAAADLREATLGKHPVRIYEALRDPNLQLKPIVTPEFSERYAENLIQYYSNVDAPLLYGFGLDELVFQADLFYFRTAVFEKDGNVLLSILRRSSGQFDERNEDFYLNYIFHEDDLLLEHVFLHLADVVKEVNWKVETEKKVALRMFALNEVEDISVLIEEPVKPDQLHNLFNCMDAELIRKSDGKKQKRLYCMKHEFEFGEFKVEQVDENGNEELRILPSSSSNSNPQTWPLDVTDFQRCVGKAQKRLEDENILMETPVTQALKTLGDNEVLYDLMNASVPALKSVRKLISVLQKNSNIYDEEILLEDLKSQARKVIEQNMDMDRRLRDTELNIGLLLKNFRSLNHTPDPKSAKKQKEDVVQANEKAKERSDEKKFFDSLSTLLYYLRVNSGRMAHFVKSVLTHNPSKNFFKHFGQLYNYGRTPMEELSMMIFIGNLLSFHIQSRREKFSFDPDYFIYSDFMSDVIWSTECFRIRSTQALREALKEMASIQFSLEVSAGLLLMRDIVARGLHNIDELMKQKVSDSVRLVIKWASKIAFVFASDVELPIAHDFLLRTVEEELVTFSDMDHRKVLLHERTLVYELGLGPYLRIERLTAELLGCDVKLDEKHKEFLGLVQQVLFASVFEVNVGLPGLSDYQDDLEKIGQAFQDVAQTHLLRNKDKPPVLLYGLGHYAQLLELPSTTIKVQKTSLSFLADKLAVHADDFEADRESQLFSLFKDLRPPCTETLEHLPNVIDLHLRALPEARLNDDRLAGDVKLETKLLVVKLLRLSLSGDSVKELIENCTLKGVSDENLEEAHALQARLAMNLTLLSKQGIINASSDFSEILRAIGQDIRNDRERRESRLVQIRDLQNVLGYSERTKKEMQAQMELFEAYESGCIKSIIGGIPSISPSQQESTKVKKFIKKKEKAFEKKEGILLNADKLIRKKLLFLDDPTTPKQVSKYSVKISPTHNAGHYHIECFRQGNSEASRIVDFEKLLRLEDEAEVRIPFHGPVVFNCPELRKFIDSKFHYKICSS
ncbi:unnamed protein product [Bursaphelenchus xylophilus]|uniref:(pine wood nematode) hypothetical protein n=1 Tax=Bursaphelenchus xylophilus TaxID=6326 RepID=A0A7I8XJ16_BURXY|nr:unnamed protein product [Bursaphelenchus xylophilus]CAG9085484.1 unnamed protein product [Bursaphelenchus xylophilus]